jgi:elongation factor 1-alpha
MNIDYDFKNIIHIDKQFPKQPPEEFYGNKEYKWKIIPKDNNMKYIKTNKLASQLMYRIYEGDGKAIYIIGILDNGTPIGLNREETYNTLEMFKDITKIIECNINKIRLYRKDNNYIITIRVSKDL